MEAISVRCTSCSQTLKVGADKAGRKIKCPKCEAVLTVPALELKKESPAPIPLTPALKPVEEEDDKGYGVVVDHELAEKRRLLEEADRKRLKEEKKKKAPKVQRRFKELPDAEDWEKVRLGLLFIFFGTLIWAFTHALQGLWVVLGTIEFQEHAHMVVEQIDMRRMDGPGPGGFWDIGQLNLLLGIVAGRAFIGFARVCLIINAVLYFLQAILWFVGYFICLSVPNRYGAKGTIITQMCLGGFNFFVVLFLKLLPLLGAYQYYLVPMVIPEVALAQYNMERVLPFHVLWSGAPFWETVLNLFLQFFFYLQPALGASFCWSIALAIKDPKLEEAGGAVTQFAFGLYFVLMAFHMISICGTTPMCLMFERVLYVLWYCFLMMFIVRYALLTNFARAVLDSKINPELVDANV
jgi:phage FluMu protein Com